MATVTLHQEQQAVQVVLVVAVAEAVLQMALVAQELFIFTTRMELL
jgi:hypothetical protein